MADNEVLTQAEANFLRNEAVWVWLALHGFKSHTTSRISRFGIFMITKSMAKPGASETALTLALRQN